MKEKDQSFESHKFLRDARSENGSAWLLDDQELNDLLARWIAPDVPASLDQKVLAAFSKQMDGIPISNMSVNNGLPGLTLSTNEEVKNMKECSTCLEAFASKFTFCPIDGTLLNETSSRGD